MMRTQNMMKWKNQALSYSTYPMNHTVAVMRHYDNKLISDKLTILSDRMPSLRHNVAVCS